jgi:energy-coupling factor transporter ATP-binding protein EcfA2
MNVSAARDNPFSTRHVRPGVIPFLFSPGQNAETLVDRLRHAGWWGEIIGRHGSGKSTLLAVLTAAIERAGQRTVLVTLHDGQRRLPLDPKRDGRLRPPMVLIVDGYEQLGRWRRLALKRFCRCQGIGLLVTAHAPMGLPLLYQTTVTLGVAELVVRQLLGDQPSPFTVAEVSQALSRRNGDLREMLFDLYDLYEQRRPSAGQKMT